MHLRIPLELIELILDHVEPDSHAALVLVSRLFRIHINRVRFNHIDFWSQEPDQMTASIHAFRALLDADAAIWAAHHPLACLAHNVHSFKYSFADYESPRALIRDTTKDGSVVAILGSIFRGLPNIPPKPGSVYHLNLGIRTSNDIYMYYWTLLPLDFRKAVDDLCINSYLNHLTLYAISGIHSTLIYLPRLVYLRLDLTSIQYQYPFTIAPFFPVLNTLVLDVYSRNSLLITFKTLNPLTPSPPLPLDPPPKVLPALKTLVCDVVRWATAPDICTLGHHISNLQELELRFKALDYDQNPDTLPQGLSYTTFQHLHTLTLHIFLPTFMAPSRIINALPLTDSTLSSISCLNLAFGNTNAYPITTARSPLDFLLNENSLAAVGAHLLALHTNISASGRKIEITVKAFPHLKISDETFNVDAFLEAAILQIRSAFPLLSTNQDVAFILMVHTKFQMADQLNDNGSRPELVI